MIGIHLPDAELGNDGVIFKFGKVNISCQPTNGMIYFKGDKFTVSAVFSDIVKTPKTSRPDSYFRKSNRALQTMGYSLLKTTHVILT